MDRLVAQVRPKSFSILAASRQLSSYKPKTFNLKTRVVSRRSLRALLALVDQVEATHLTDPDSLSIPPLVVDTTYASISEPNPLFPFPGRIGPDPKAQTKQQGLHVGKLDPYRYGVDGRTILNDLLAIKLPMEHQKDSISQLMKTHMEVTSADDKSEFISKLLKNDNLEICAHECPAILRHDLHRLFLNYNTVIQPLTAITITYKTKLDMSMWSHQIEAERNELTDQFVELAHEICAYLNKKQYWADFIDPTNGRPYYGPHTTDTLFETDERLRYFGINILDLGCCRVVEHLQHGTHIFVGCIFTSALKNDANVQHILKDFVAPTTEHQTSASVSTTQ